MLRTPRKLDAALAVRDARAGSRGLRREGEGGEPRRLGALGPLGTARSQLHQALDRDQSLLDVLDLEPGQRAERRKLLGGWKRGAY